MFSHIRTSKENKDVVTRLTNKHNLGTENIIARIALAYSLSRQEALSLETINDSSGKEYSRSVLFGEDYDLYVGLISKLHEVSPNNKDIPRYVKLHIDAGLRLLNTENQGTSTLTGLISSIT